jgi:hypothetical protein
MTTGEERPMVRRSEKQKMLAGELYLAADAELAIERRRARRLTRLFNQTTEDAIPEREALLRELLGATGARIEIEPPFYCDYGSKHLRRRSAVSELRLRDPRLCSGPLRSERRVRARCPHLCRDPSARR